MQGIPFNEQGVTGILARIKTMTRRPMKVNHHLENVLSVYETLKKHEYKAKELEKLIIEEYAKYKIGETVFVQENFEEHLGEIYYGEEPRSLYSKIRPPSEMTEQQSRIKLKIIGIKVERLQDISPEDCYREGLDPNEIAHLFIDGDDFSDATQQTIFRDLIWQPLPYPPKYQWSANPIAFTYEFEEVQ